MVRKKLRFNFMLDSQMSEVIKEAKLVVHYLIGYSLLLCKLMKTYLHYFTGKILSKHSSATVLIFNFVSWKEGSIASNNQYMVWKFNVLWVLHSSINWFIYGNIFRYSTTVLTLLPYSKVHMGKETLTKQWMINNYHLHSCVYTSRFSTIQRCTTICFRLSSCMSPVFLWADGQA